MAFSILKILCLRFSSATVNACFNQGTNEQMTSSRNITIRPVKDSDAEALFTLVGDCFAEYDDVFLDRDDLDSDLKAYESYLRDLGGQGFVALKGDQLVASVACAPSGENTFELKRLYLSTVLRGTGMGLTLLKTVEGVARKAGATHMDAWSDTRFLRAHRFYEREGYVRGPETRDLNDISNSVEYYFIKPL